MVAPSFTQLSQSVESLGRRRDSLKVAAQNVNAAASGAYTGEVSASNAKRGRGGTTVVLGHSERRSLVP